MADAPIVIAGGGVAGAVLATLLARSGRRVLVVERRVIGESKCCGCCLAPRGVLRLKELGLGDALDDAGAVATRRWRLRGEGGHVLFEEALGAGAGAVVSRDHFDTALLDRAQRAGAVVARGASMHLGSDGVVSIRSRGGAVAERLQPALVVGADGVGSGVARAAGLLHAPERGQAPRAQRVARRTDGRRRLGFSWRLDDAESASLAMEPETIDIHLAIGGYLGLVRDARGVCAAALADGAAPGSRVRAWACDSAPLDCLVDCEPTERRDFAATGPLPWRPAAIARGAMMPQPGVALVGDAAGYEQPFTGEGMTWAIESAVLLASNMASAAQWNDATAARYAQAHASMFAMRRWRLRTIARIGERASQSRWLERTLRIAGRVPLIPGMIVRSVVAA